ncbi:hypothetical protein FB45DRAFT_73858 [Roridomyces roridus]|uniref:Uncharacterized protein n=1 Tax=Roridomyces roridus TaxID=1738132 RepID=A0AAD7FIL5_9AGAR|nr:hypothetical protein FB45DRAFT_73858 [Roridomyces roridus]
MHRPPWLTIPLAFRTTPLMLHHLSFVSGSSMPGLSTLLHPSSSWIPARRWCQRLPYLPPLSSVGWWPATSASSARHCKTPSLLFAKPTSTSCPRVLLMPHSSLPAHTLRHCCRRSPPIITATSAWSGPKPGCCGRRLPVCHLPRSIGHQSGATRGGLSPRRIYHHGHHLPPISYWSPPKPALAFLIHPPRESLPVVSWPRMRGHRGMGRPGIDIEDADRYCRGRPPIWYGVTCARVSDVSGLHSASLGLHGGG